jgi:hypothetical protein
MALSEEQITEITDMLTSKFRGDSSELHYHILWMDAGGKSDQEKLVIIRDEWFNKAKTEYSTSIVGDTTVYDLKKLALENAYKILNQLKKDASGPQAEPYKDTAANDNTYLNAKVGQTSILAGTNATSAKTTLAVPESPPQQATDEQKDVAAHENRLSEQAALILTLPDILEKVYKTIESEASQSEAGASAVSNRVVTAKTKVYKNFSPIRYNNENDTPTGHFFLTSNFTKSPSMDVFFRKIPPQILSFLVPSIKLYKTFYPVNQSNPNLRNIKGYDWRIPFDDVPVAYKNETSAFAVQSVEDVLNGNGGFHSVGIKSFSYEYRGVNPAEINTNIHSTIEIYFQNPAELVKEISISWSDGRFVTQPPNSKENIYQSIKFSYSDLINQTSRLLEGYTNVFNDQYYRLKVECGYADIQEKVIRDVLDSAGYSKKEQQDEYIRAIKSTKTFLYLSPYQYNVNFNEDGSVILKIDFISSMDSMMTSPESDIFSLDKTTRNVQRANKDFQEFLDAKQAIKNLSESTEDSNCQNSESLKEKVKEFLKKPEYKHLENKSDEEVIQYLTDMKYSVYNGIYNYLIGKEVLHDKENINLTIQPKIYKAIFRPELLGVNNPSTKNVSEQRINIFKNSQQLLGVEESFSDDDLIPFSEDKKQDKADSTNPSRDDKARQSLNERLQKYRDSVEDSYNIKFILLGDLLDVVLETLNYIEPINDSPRVVIGNIPFTIPTRKFVTQDKDESFDTTGETRGLNPNLADIPISLNLLQEFLLKNVVKDKKTNYPVLQFVKDIISQLIFPAIGPSVLGKKYAINTSIRFSTAYLSLPTVNGQDAITGRSLNDRNYPPIINESALKRIENLRNKGALLNEANLSVVPAV